MNFLTSAWRLFESKRKQRHFMRPLLNSHAAILYVSSRHQVNPSISLVQTKVADVAAYHLICKIMSAYVLTWRRLWRSRVWRWRAPCRRRRVAGRSESLTIVPSLKQTVRNLRHSKQPSVVIVRKRDIELLGQRRAWRWIGRMPESQPIL